MGSFVRYYRVMQTESFEDMREKEFGYSHGIDRFGTRDNDYPLHKAMVNHDQNRIFAADFWEVSDEVNRDLFERERGRGGDWT